MNDEEILAGILTVENLAKYDKEGQTGNIFIGIMPETQQKTIDLTLRKTGGSRQIKKLTGSRQLLITIYARGSVYEDIQNLLEQICSTTLNKTYDFTDFIVQNVFVFTEPSWLLKDDENNNLFNTTLTLTVTNL